MNVKDSGIGPALVVGLILSAVNIWWPRSGDRDTATATSLATLTERVSTLSGQVSKLTEQPYARREEVKAIEDRVTGLDERLGEVEREVRTKRNR